MNGPAEEEESFDSALLFETGSILQMSYERIDYTVEGKTVHLELRPGVSRPNMYSDLLVTVALNSVFENFVDLGCGSGAIGVQVAVHHPTRPFVVSIDVDGDCLDLTRHNAELNGVSARVNVRQANWLEGSQLLPRTLIACSPPHTPCPAERLVAETRSRPAFAMSSFGGLDGLDALRQILSVFLVPGVPDLIVAVGGYQVRPLRELCSRLGLAAEVVASRRTMLSPLGRELRPYIEATCRFVFPEVDGVPVNDIAAVKVRSESHC